MAVGSPGPILKGRTSSNPAVIHKGHRDQGSSHIFFAIPYSLHAWKSRYFQVHPWIWKAAWVPCLRQKQCSVTWYVSSFCFLCYWRWTYTWTRVFDYTWHYRIYILVFHHSIHNVFHFLSLWFSLVGQWKKLCEDTELKRRIVHQQTYTFLVHCTLECHSCRGRTCPAKLISMIQSN